jgi:dTDP-4-amino-4,6-dideoxygalactose transaminase
MSATHGLELALAYYKIGKGDEVITTPLTYTATADVIEYCGAKPVFVDVEESTGNIDVGLIEKKITKKTKAIIPVHLYGQMIDQKALNRLAKKYKLHIIEDAAHCLEGQRDGLQPGQLSDVAVFSFYATKAISSGEGGALVTNNKDMYLWARKARNHGLNREVAQRHLQNFKHYDKEFLGYKTNMSNIQAALLVHQLDRVNANLKIKEKICKEFDKSFSKVKEVKILNKIKGVKHARHLYTILVPPEKRDNLVIELKKKGVAVVVNYIPVHLLSYYRKKYNFHMSDYPAAEKIGFSTISLPLYSKLKDKEVKYIISAVKNALAAL